MKQKNTFTFLILPIFFMYGCNYNKAANNKVNESVQTEQTETDSEMKLDSNCFFINDISFDKKDEFLKFIQQEKKEFYSQPSSNPNDTYEMQYTYRSAPYIFPIFSYWLKKKDYKSVSDEVFKARIKEVFNISLSAKCEDIQIHDDYIEYLTYQASEPEGGIVTVGSFLFSLKYKLFFRPPFNGYLLEEVDPSKQYQTCFDEKEYHYNNFIFNNSKSSLTWLINNDLDFLEILVREFGYGKDAKINKAVLDKIYKDYRSTQPANDKALLNFFAKKDCIGNLQIREDLLKFISNGAANTDDYRYIEMIDNYATSMIYNDYYHTDNNIFTKDERLKIATYLGYYIQLYYDKYQNPEDIDYFPVEGAYSGSFYRNQFVDDKIGLIEYIQKNNYFNLPGLKDMIESVNNQIITDTERYNRQHSNN